MFKNKYIGIFGLLLTVTACITATIPEAYNFRTKELQTNPFGSWVELKVDPQMEHNYRSSFSGELLNLSPDSLHLLVSDGVVKSFKTSSIVSANLYTHRNQANTYLTTTALLSVPGFVGVLAQSEYAGEFLFMTLPTILVGAIHAAIESNKQRNVLVYPYKNNLNDLAPFSRFPAGIPKNVDFRLLYLKSN